MKEIRSTTPLLSLKTLTLSCATREMAISRSTTSTGVELDDKRGHVTSHTSRQDRDGSVDNDWGSNGQRNIIVVGVGDSYGWRSLRRSMSSSLSRGKAWLNQIDIGHGSNWNRSVNASTTLDEEWLKLVNGISGDKFRKDEVLIVL